MTRKNILREHEQFHVIDVLKVCRAGERVTRGGWSWLSSTIQAQVGDEYVYSCAMRSL